jgi:hypothetical protein
MIAIIILFPLSNALDELLHYLLLFKISKVICRAHEEPNTQAFFQNPYAEALSSSIKRLAGIRMLYD